jgi:hypothetical protein
LHDSAVTADALSSNAFHRQMAGMVELYLAVHRLGRRADRLGQLLVRALPVALPAHVHVWKAMRAALFGDRVAARAVEASGLAGLAAADLGEMHRMRESLLRSRGAGRDDREHERREHRQ